jgi:ketosteroid isomerase-like protein
MRCTRAVAMVVLSITVLSSAAAADDAADQKQVARLDVEYQAAVKRNDADAMARILDERFVLVLGNGKTFTRKDLLDWAKRRDVIYEKQDEVAGTPTVRVFGDTAVVTALLWLKGVQAGKPIEQRLWFSDTYVRTKAGWKYVFGQASLPLPPEK